MTGADSSEEVPGPCPHCGSDLTDKWIGVSVSWSEGDVVESEMVCPDCGLDMTDTSLPSLEEIIEWECASPTGSSVAGSRRGRALSSLSGVGVAGIEALVPTLGLMSSVPYNISPFELESYGRSSDVHE